MRPIGRSFLFDISLNYEYWICFEGYVDIDKML
jgi:hypothetical protein